MNECFHAQKDGQDSWQSWTGFDKADASLGQVTNSHFSK